MGLKSFLKEKGFIEDDSKSTSENNSASSAYILDLLYLTHFYITGKKLKRITSIAKAYPFKRKLKKFQSHPLHHSLVIEHVMAL